MPREIRIDDAFVEQAEHYLARKVHADDRETVRLTQLRQWAGSYRPAFVKAIVWAVRDGLLVVVEPYPGEPIRVRRGPNAPRNPQRGRGLRGEREWSDQIRAELDALRDLGQG